eukprot:m.229869 g.229869  ORF g.229869 m.229869 type:complete len:502 (-) comp17863_c0_seq1:121-1626(-)
MAHRFSSMEGVGWKTHVLVGSAAAILLYGAYEQYRFRRWSKTLDGPSVAVPFIGSIVEMVKNPYEFWEKQRLFNPDGLSWNSIVGQFMVMSTNTKITRKIFSHNGEDSFRLFLHPNGWKILGEHNIAFKHGPEHRALRKSFLSLFTKPALSVYLSLQQKLIREHIAQWIANKEFAEYRIKLRDLNLITSQTVFVGPYLTTDEARAEFCHNYLLLTEGFLSFPLALPGTGLWNAVKARHKIVAVLQQAAHDAKARMAGGANPECLLDFWAQRINEELAEAARTKTEAGVHCSDWEMGNTLMDFLFASQDASTASLTWCAYFMCERPDILAKVREEQQRVRPNDEPLTYEMIEKELHYTRAVVKEILRFRPPAVMVPAIAMVDFPLTPTYTVPKGTLVVPSIWSACMQGFPEPEKFDPDRMMPDRQEDVTYSKNFLTFGVGPHMCVGREYAINHLVAFLSLFATQCDAARQISATSHEIKYLPTIYPGDCILYLNASQQPATN